MALHEGAGDVARDHHFHDGAAQHYQTALSVRDISDGDRSRLSEKLAYVLFRGGNPNAAAPWLERALPQNLDDPREAAKAVEILLQAWRVLWVDGKIEEASPIIARAVHLANTTDDVKLKNLTKSRMLMQLRSLGKYSEAEQLLHRLERIRVEDDVADVAYFKEKAMFFVRRGEAAAAYDYFEQAVRAAAKRDDPYYLMENLESHTVAAIRLGNIQLGKTCVERALLIARQDRLIWILAYFCLLYAHILRNLGEYHAAYGFLLEALSYNVRATIVKEMVAIAGIPLALYLKDETTLIKCARMPGDTTNAECSIALAQMYASQGKNNVAQAFLSKALDRPERLHTIWALPIEVARYGKHADLPRARRLLQAQLQLPSSEIANASLRLFDAFVAQRKGHTARMQTEAGAAATLFERMHWYAYAEIARTLLSADSQPLPAPVHKRPFLDLQPALTEREQQVVELVLGGLSNRAIAEALSIKERTVEAHMTSIMGRLGIRSRYQLLSSVPAGQP